MGEKKKKKEKKDKEKKDKEKKEEEKATVRSAPDGSDKHFPVKIPVYIFLLRTSCPSYSKSQKALQ